jgi:hypothetical protein
LERTTSLENKREESKASQIEGEGGGVPVLGRRKDKRDG